MCVEMKRTSAVALGSLWSSPNLFLQVSSVSVLLCSPGAVIHLAMCVQPDVGSPGKALCAVCSAAGEAVVFSFAVVGHSRVQSISKSLPCLLQQHAES